MLRRQNTQLAMAAAANQSPHGLLQILETQIIEHVQAPYLF